MEFFRQEYWSGLPLPLPGYLPDPGIKPESHALQADSLPSELPGKPHYYLLGLKWQTTPHSSWKMPWTEEPSRLYSPCDRKSWTRLKDQTTTISKIQFCVSLSVFVFYLVFCVLSVLTLFPMASGGFCALFTYSHPAFSSPFLVWSALQGCVLTVPDSAASSNSCFLLPAFCPGAYLIQQHGMVCLFTGRPELSLGSSWALYSSFSPWGGRQLLGTFSTAS